MASKSRTVAGKNNTKFEIIKDLPMPTGRISKKGRVYPFENMNIGDGFKVIQKKAGASKVYAASASFCRKPENFHKRFSVKKISEKTEDGKTVFVYGCWRRPDLTALQKEEKKKKLANKRK